MYITLPFYLDPAVFKPSDFSIINTDSKGDFDIEDHLTVRDDKDRKLELRLNYVYVAG